MGLSVDIFIKAPNVATPNRDSPVEIRENVQAAVGAARLSTRGECSPAALIL